MRGGQDYRGYFTSKANNVRSGNDKSNNGIALVMMAFLSPWMMLGSSQYSMSLISFHQNFDILQDAFNRKSNLRQLKGRSQNKKARLERNPDFFQYHTAEDIAQGIINSGQAPEIILLAYLRALSLATFYRLNTNSSSSVLNLNNVFGRFITADLLRIIVHNQFFCHIALGRTNINPDTWFGDAQSCRDLANNQPNEIDFPDRTFIAAIPAFLEMIRSWDRDGILRFINTILGTQITAVQATEQTNGDLHTGESQRRATASAPEPEGVTIDTKCMICLEPTTAPVAITPCGHLVFCEPCINRHRDVNGPTCPICRGAIKNIIRLYPQ